MFLPISELWAKMQKNSIGVVYTKPLLRHMDDVGTTMQILLTRTIYQSDVPLLSELTSLPSEQVINLLCYLAAMHDVGKADPYFQCRDEEPYSQLPIHKVWADIAPPTYAPLMAGSYRHEIGSEQYMEKKLRGTTSREVAKTLGAILGLHHQGKGPSVSPYPGSVWQAARQELDDIFEEKWEPAFPQTIKRVDVFGMLTSALIILADWIASSDILSNSNCMREDQIASALESFMDSAGLKKKAVPEVKSFVDAWAFAGINKPSPMQKMLSDYVDALRPDEMPMVTLIESEPGSGKTEAAIYTAIKVAQAYGKSGIYFGLPTMATANNMVDRINDFQSAHQVMFARLLHGMAWMQKDVKMPPDAAGWFSPARLGLLQSIGVGTVDQAMAAVTPVKYGMLRLLGLSNKVLIIDEVHSYDDYMLTIIKRLLEYCKAARIPVIMLSATLPAVKKKDLLAASMNTKTRDSYVPSMEYPLVTMLDKKGNVQAQLNPKATFHRWYGLKMLFNYQDEDIVHKMIGDISGGGCAFYFANTVSRAQKIYEIVKKYVDKDTEVLLFHARFTAGRRKELEDCCKKLFGKDKTHRPKKAILIATQVIEQSMDIDADIIYTDLAPIDMLLQRIGREYRHDDTPRPYGLNQPVVNVVVSPWQAKTNEFIYEKEYLERTVKALSKEKSIRIPEDIRPLIEDVYGTYASPNSDLSALLKAMEKGVAANSKRQIPCRLVPKPQGSDPMFMDVYRAATDTDDPAMTRNGAESVRLAVIPQTLMDKLLNEQKAGRVTKPLAQRVMEYSVPCYLSKFNKLNEDLKSKFIDGEGLLFGMKIASVNDPISPEDDASISGNGESVRVSREYGLIL